MAYLVPRYDPALVLASVVIATLSACVMPEFAKRALTMGRLAARSMLLAGSVAMGTGDVDRRRQGAGASSAPGSGFV